MNKNTILLVIACWFCASARRVEAPCARQGSCTSARWREIGDPSGTSKIPLILAVRQRNIGSLRKFVDSVSSPGPLYGRYMSFEEVVKTTLDTEATAAVSFWLSRNNFSEIKHHIGGFFSCVHSVAAIERLFEANLRKFLLPQTPFRAIRAYSHEIPKQIAPFVDFISGISDFPILDQHSPILQFEGSESYEINATTPSKLLHAYNVPPVPSRLIGIDKATQSIFAALGQYYSPEDLFDFQSHFKLPHKDITQVVGKNDPGGCLRDPGACAEANLDVQYILAVSPFSPTTFWSMEGSGADLFLTWITDVASDPNPPLIHSVSYGGPEPEFPEEMVRRVDDEFMKLGARGVTIVVASGDDGVAGNAARNNPRACGFVPSYPASLPHVVSVGATMGIEHESEEIACTSDHGGLITTGGGFSFLFESPQFQKTKLNGYLKSSSDLPDTTLFNYAGRGFPDVAVAGHNFVVSIGGRFYQLSGTSASAPVFAGMLSLINAERIKVGLPPIGWATPALWHIAGGNPTVFKDVTSGRNNCCAAPINPTCCPDGFTAAPGWDPVSGFGSVDFEELRSEWLAL